MCRRENDAVRPHGHPARFVFRSDRLTGRRDANESRVTVMAVAHRSSHRFNQVGRCHGTRKDRVTDIQIANGLTGGFDLAGFGHDIRMA